MQASAAGRPRWELASRPCNSCGSASPAAPRAPARSRSRRDSKERSRATVVPHDEQRMHSRGILYPAAISATSVWILARICPAESWIAYFGMQSPIDLSSIPPPPRRVRRQRGYLRIGLLHVLLVFLVIVAHMFWTNAIRQVRITWFSSIVPAKVMAVRTLPGNPAPGHEITVAYQYEGTDYTNDLRISPSEAATLKEGDVVQMWVQPDWPAHAQRYDEHYPGLTFALMCCSMALVPTLGILKLLWDLYLAPWRLGQLIREGEATTGVIVDKKEVKGRTASYTITYRYQAPRVSGDWEPIGPPVSYQASMTVYPRDFRRTQVGDTVVVFYHSARPNVSVLMGYTD